MSRTDILERLVDAIEAQGISAGLVSATTLYGELTSAASDIEVSAPANKELLLKLGDNAGVKKVKVLDSDDQVVASIDSNGVITGTGLAGPLTGNVTGNLVGSVSGAETIVAKTATDLTITADGDEDIKVKMGDAAGTNKVSFIDSADAEVASLDSNGGLTAVTLAGKLTGGVTFPASSGIDFQSGHADYTLDATEQESMLLTVTAADQAANIIAPAANKMYVVRNASGAAITIKKAAGTGVAIADGKTAIVMYGGADYVRVTADATH